MSIAVYNFKVEDFHTYFIGYSGVLVHNAYCGETAVDTTDQTTQQKKAEQLAKNREQGKLYQDAEVNKLKSNSNLSHFADEVTLRPMNTDTNQPMTKGGIRVDGIAMDGEKIVIYEMKSSENASFTRNQIKAGYNSVTETLAKDYVVVGTKGGEFWNKIRIIPAGTEIRVIRPE